MTEQFKVDLKRGLVGEEYIAGMFKSWGYGVERVDGYFPDHDLVITTPQGNRRTLEIKYDYRAEETGNLALELDALRHSKAQFLAIAIGDPIQLIYIAPLQEVLRLAESWPNKKPVGERGEISALVPIPAFIQHINPQVLTTN